MKVSSILSYTGNALEIIGILILFPIIFALILGENTLVPFMVASIFSFVLGTFLDKKFKKEKIDMETAMILSAFVILIVSLIGAIPYVFFMAPIDAIFESVSGFTTTGLSVLTPESLPYSILFWRSLTQWIGGLGILMMFLLLVGSPGISAYHIYKAEGRVQRIEPSMRSTIKRISLIYIAYTIIGVALLSVFGMPLFDSINHSMTSVSTGGFSVKNASIGYYHSVYIDMVVMILMILGATSFFIHDKIIRKKFMEYIKNQETRMFWIIIIIFSFLMSFSYFGRSDAIMQSVFHVISALTTTGFTIADGGFPASSIFFLIILMVIGAYAGSTGGGIKLVRFNILLSSIRWLVKKTSLPVTAIIPVKVDGKKIKKSEITIVSLFVFIYIAILGLSSIALSMSGYSPIDSIFTVASAQGTVGLTTAEIAPLPALGKITLIVCMLLGRLEILPFLVTIYKIIGLRKVFE